MDVRHSRAVAGKTRWRRFAAFALPSTVLTGVILVAMANGAIAASFAVSGSSFKVSASSMDGTGFVQYGSAVQEKSGALHPVAVAGIPSATITNLCQSVTVPGTPFSVILHAGGGKTPASATGLMFDLASLQADAQFTDITIGQDASTLNAAGPNAHGAAGGFGQQASHITLTNVKQTAWSASAGTFNLNDMDLQVSLTGAQCF